MDQGNSGIVDFNHELRLISNTWTSGLTPNSLINDVMDIVCSVKYEYSLKPLHVQLQLLKSQTCEKLATSESLAKKFSSKFILIKAKQYRYIG
jgi:hypothetical protein